MRQSSGFCIALRFIFVALFLFSQQGIYAQTNQELALQKARQALKLEDEEGKYDEALQLLEEAHKLDPGKITYEYEMAYTWSAKKEYQKAVTILERLRNHPDVHDRVYQMLGNSYDYLGKSALATATYNEGLKKFPNSGELYLELGNMHWVKNEFSEALGYYEKGIEKDPAFSSNYYRATRIYCASDVSVWGMIYGEIFMNLERNSARTAEISGLLYKTYKKNIRFNGGDSASVAFCNYSQMTVSDLEKKRLPFGSFCYEMNLIVAITFEKQVDLESMDRIRTAFVENYLKGDCAKNYPNILFDYQRKLQRAGHFSAYNHWILMKGEEDAFIKWKESHSKEFDAFAKWFHENPLQVDAANKFYSGDY